MPNRLLRSLGWDTRRMRVMLTLAEWEWVEVYAKAKECTPTSVIETFARMEIERRIANRRYSLTPEGEAAADDGTVEHIEARLAEGKTEW